MFQSSILKLRVLYALAGRSRTTLLKPQISLSGSILCSHIRKWSYVFWIDTSWWQDESRCLFLLLGVYVVNYYWWIRTCCCFHDHREKLLGSFWYSNFYLYAKQPDITISSLYCYWLFTSICHSHIGFHWIQLLKKAKEGGGGSGSEQLVESFPNTAQDHGCPLWFLWETKVDDLL